MNRHNLDFLNLDERLTGWEKLAEARIAEWLQKTPGPTAGSSDCYSPAISFEMQILQSILDLYDQAAITSPELVPPILKNANELEIQILSMLEVSGRPLAAQHISRLLLKARQSVLGKQER